MINEVIINEAYKDFSKNITDNPWVGTPYEKYFSTGAKQKGSLGELIVEKLLTSQGKEVEKALNVGHDRVVNGHKTEIKFSCASLRNTKWHFTFNHIGFKKDWERIIFCGVNGDLEDKVVWFTKEELYSLVEEGLLKHQQGGKEEGLDDFICSSTNSSKLLSHPLSKTLEVF